MKNKIIFVILIFTLSACGSTTGPAIQKTDLHNTAIAIAQTSIPLTQAALPTSPPTQAPTETPKPVLMITLWPFMPSNTPTATSMYEADHEAIRKVIASYLDQIYYMHSSFQVGGLDDVVSSAPDGRSFLKTKLRKLAVEIIWSRREFFRYASYSYDLNYSEIVVFDSAQRARANFTETQYKAIEHNIPFDTVQYGNQIEHIIMLRHEQNGWKIIYDVYNDYMPYRSLYDPTPIPKEVLDNLDGELISLNQAQGGAVLPEAGKIFIPSDPTQLKHWKDYETALADKLMPQYPRDTVLCEWELTDKSLQKINVWAVCMSSVTSADIGNYFFPAASVPAIININPDGSVLSVEIPKYGPEYMIDFFRLFPNGAWKDLPNVVAMEKHLHWRRTHPTEPPLVVLNTTAFLTATPTAVPTP